MRKMRATVARCGKNGRSMLSMTTDLIRTRNVRLIEMAREVDVFAAADQALRSRLMSLSV